MKRDRVVVIGGGVGGLATALFLGAEERLDVTLLEREASHDVHSSGRSAEILRTAIDQPFTAELALRSAKLLRSPSLAGLKDCEAFVDDRGLFVVTGSDTPPWWDLHRREGVAREVSLRELSAAAPHFRPSGERVFHLPQCGRIDAGRLLSTLAQAAASRGVTFERSGEPAQPIVENARVVGVRKGARVIPCDRVVVAAGAWTRQIAADLGVTLPLRSTRRHMWVASSAPSTPASAPIVWDDTAGFYARPETLADGTTAWAFSSTDLDDYAPSPTESGAKGPMYALCPSTEAAAYDEARLHLPGEALQPIRAWRGFRDLQPDDHPILGPEPTISGLYWCAGLGGHGMTLSLAAGQLVADALSSTVPGTSLRPQYGASAISRLAE